MNTHRLSLTVALLGLSTLLATSAARACKYCMAAESAEAQYAKMTALPPQPDPTTGAFPLDNTISQFQPAAAPTTLATPPPAGSVVTNAADLRPLAAKVPAVKTPVATATMQAAPAAPAPKSGHFADAGLLGLAAVGGVFCWRTRRKTGSES